jgi:hypothetical protein
MNAGDLWLTCPIPPIRGEYTLSHTENIAEDNDDTTAIATTTTTTTDAYNDMSSSPKSRLSSEWKAELDKLIQSYIAKTQKDQAVTISSKDNAKEDEYLMKAKVIVEKSLDTFLKEFCFPEVHDDGSNPVFRCNVDGCKKRFKAASFVHKHLQTKHSNLLKKFEAKDLIALTSEIYLNDKDKFVPSVEDGLGSTMFSTSFVSGGVYSRGPGFVSNRGDSSSSMHSTHPRYENNRPYANPTRSGDSGRYSGASSYGRVGNGREIKLDVRSSLNKNNPYHDVDAPKMDDVDLDYGDF